MTLAAAWDAWLAAHPGADPYTRDLARKRLRYQLDPEWRAARRDYARTRKRRTNQIPEDRYRA